MIVDSKGWGLFCNDLNYQSAVPQRQLTDARCALFTFMPTWLVAGSLVDAAESCPSPFPALPCVARNLLSYWSMRKLWMHALWATALTACGTTNRRAAVVGPAPAPHAHTSPTTVADVMPAITYNLFTTIDLTGAGLVPRPLATIAEFAQAFATSPGHAVLDAAAAAKVPGLQTLVSNLPSSIEKRLAGAIDRAVAANGSNAKVQTEVAAIAALAAQVLGVIELESQLTGMATRHTARQLAVVVRDERMTVPVVVFEKIGGSAPVELKVTGTAVMIGEHRLGVRLGSTLWSLVEFASIKQTGFTPGQRISRALACADVAARVAATCIAKVCVGHSAAVQEVCEAGGQAAIAKVQAQFAALDYDAFTFHQGEATRDSRAITLHGTWELLLDVGMGPRQARATFAGVAQASTPTP